MAELLTVKEVAELLELSEQRVYQMDTELEPVKHARGARTVTRHYEPAIVERVRLARLADAAGAAIGVSQERQVISRLTRAARAVDMSVDVSVGEVAELSAKPCAFCNAVAAPRHGLVRLFQADGFTRANLVPACRMCVEMMGEGDARSLVEHALRIARHSCGLEVEA